jgi:ABC transport system ATP-binding/permease protein
MVKGEKLKLGFVSENELLLKFAFQFGYPTEVVIGRDETSQIRLQKSVISKQHAQLIFDANSDLFVIDLGSSNGTFLNDRRLEKGVPYQVRSTDKLRFSGQQGVTLVFNPDDYIKEENSTNNQKENITNTNILEKFKSKKIITVGRSEDNDVVLNHSSISRRHATIEKKSDNEFEIVDQNSTNGTYINGKRLVGSLKISKTDTIIIGRYQLSLNGVLRDLSKEVAIRAERIVKQFENGKIGLHECSFEIPSKSLLAVMGPSGCGKSTLLKALNGDAPPSSGTIYIGGLELNSNYDYLKTQIGYVPQDDIVHKELTVQQSLYYAAKLRLHNADDSFIQQKINQVINDLNIGHIRENLVGKISGGQRKRVSIAVEILTDPLILFLDEPTSPLDPQTIEEFLEILRNLSKKGTTVIMVTHKPEDLNYMDSVIFMAEGGHKVYHGASTAYLSYFNANDTINVYAQLALPAANKWINQHKQTHPPLANLKNEVRQQSKVNSSNFFSQLYWLTMRNFNIKLNDTVNTSFLVGQAPIIAVLICMIFNKISPAVLFLIAVSAIWFGTNNAAREIVGEAAIYKRERMFNQRILAYILSKITVLGTFAAIQAFIFSLIIYLRYQQTDLKWEEPISTFLWMLTISISASLMGLLLSATVATAEKAMTIVPIILIPQIMLAGALAKIENKFIEGLSYITLSRWGNEGFSHIQWKVVVERPDLTNFNPTNENNSLELKDTTVNAIQELEKSFHPSYKDWFGDFAYTLKLDITVIFFLSLIFFVGIYRALKRKDAIKMR